MGGGILDYAFGRCGYDLFCRHLEKRLLKKFKLKILLVNGCQEVMKLRRCMHVVTVKFANDSLSGVVSLLQWKLNGNP